MTWYAVHTAARAERLAHRRLAEQGFETLYLHYAGTIRHARRVIGVMKPLFPRYLFVNVAPGQGVGTVNDTDGVSTIVRGPDGPYEIPEAVIERMRGWCVDASGRVPTPPGEGERRRLPAGTEVTIADPASPWRGIIATVTLDMGDELRVLMDLFGGKVEATMPVQGVEPVSPEWMLVGDQTPQKRRARRR